MLVATEPIPACTEYEGWTDSMELARLEASTLPAGALINTAIVAEQVLLRDVAAGDVIKAQLFGKASKCSGPHRMTPTGPMRREEAAPWPSE